MEARWIEGHGWFTESIAVIPEGWILTDQTLSRNGGKEMNQLCAQPVQVKSVF